MAELGGLTLRTALASDLGAIESLHEAAFEGGAEARLVRRLHERCDRLVSIVAELDAQIAGHILFSPVRLEPPAAIAVWGLAPMAVLPSLQRSGIGARLVTAGLDACRVAGADAVVVLGHRNYYPKFGFRAAAEFGLRSTYDVPAGVFMALELRPSALTREPAVVHYHPAFADS